MKRVMVQYKVKVDRADENVRFIEGVFAQLASERPEGLRYASFKLADGLSFVHLASIETTDGSNPLAALAAFRAFVSAIADRCEVPPSTAELHQVGAYRLFGAETTT